MNVQRIVAPDGSEMVVLSAADYDALLAASEDSRDRADAKAGLESAGRDGTMPSEVLSAILKGDHPIVAWCRFRGITQSELARRAGFTPVWVSRIINGGAFGSRTTRAKLAAVLDAPLWALESDND
jgi:hypothetical protein